MKRIIQFISNQKAKLLAGFTTLTLAPQMVIMNVLAEEGDKLGLKPYQKEAYEVLKEIANIGGFVALVIALLIIMFGNREFGKSMALWVIIAYIAIQLAATIWGVLTAI